jgi:hypothetical protein
MTRLAAGVAVALALALATTAFARGTWAVGGSDSSCYALMVDAFANGALQPASDLVAKAPWPRAAVTFAPAGFIPSPVHADRASPICTPGFSLIMLPFRLLAGRDGIFLLMPLAAGLLVWSVFVAARNLSDDVGGITAALIVATTPIVLFQAVQPMNDVTTAMLWAAVFASATAADQRRRAPLLGALTGLAVLVRPNLAPLGAVVALWVLRGGVRALTQFVLFTAPSLALMLFFNWALYGHPLRVGYGSVGQMFSPDHIPINLARYGRTFLETLTPAPLLALAAPFVVARELRDRVWLGLAIALTTLAIYLLYDSYPEWWYLRFLLPALVLLITLAAAVTTRMIRRPLIVLVMALVLAVFGVITARERQAFDLQRLEARFPHAGSVVRDRLPRNAILVTVWQSGTMRYHAEREIVMWDSLEPAMLTFALDWLRQQGREPYLLLERWEEPAFRSRFAAQSTFGMLDWPPRIEIDRQVRIYAPTDREAYLGGRAITTEHVFPQ